MCYKKNTPLCSEVRFVILIKRAFKSYPPLLRLYCFYFPEGAYPVFRTPSPVQQGTKTKAVITPIRLVMMRAKKVAMVAKPSSASMM